MQLYKHASINNIGLEPVPFYKELIMQAYLIENPEALDFDSDDLSNVQIIEQEMVLKHGRQSKGGDGRIDLLGLYNDQTVAVIELKNATLNLHHFNQINDYLSQSSDIRAKADEILQASADTEMELAPNPKMLGILVGTDIDLELRTKILNGLSSNGSHIAALILNRFRGSDGSIYVFCEQIIKQSSTKDYTKYQFRGQLYGKGRLVLAVVKTFAEESSHLSLKTLTNAFPSEWSKTKGRKKSGHPIIVSEDEAINIFNNKGRARHFIKPKELVRLTSGASAAVSSQWGIGNIHNFIDGVKQAHGYEITEISSA